MKKQRITKDMKIADVVSANPNAAEILFSAGLMCVGCPMAMQENLEQGMLAHGIDEKEIEKVIKELNK